MSKTRRPFVVLALLTLTASWAGAHCEVPCGIYDDQMRIDLILEHATTIEKAMKEAASLDKAGPGNANQLVRWITNKELHATEVQQIVTQYFMTQRIKPDTGDYAKKLAVLHQMLLAAMKCKQTTDTAHVETLRKLTTEFSKLYFAQE